MGLASSNEDRWERAEGVLLGGFAPSAQLRGDNLSSQVGCPSFDSSLSFRLTQNPRKRFFLSPTFVPVESPLCSLLHTGFGPSRLRTRRFLRSPRSA